ncbi:MAG: DsbA family protein [Longimicrobiales bacterium]|nr:DsbA family protein [Longimicrobiales bacterium]
MTAWEKLNPPPTRGAGPRKDREISSWVDLAETGHRVGPRDARVTIIVFGDYDCPFCRRAEGPLRAVLDEYPNDVAVVYRNLPLRIHEHAYQAARLAECGAEQGRFYEVHRFLYNADDLDPLRLQVETVGHAVEIPDLAAFSDCASRVDPVARIEEDLRVAEALDIVAVPAIIFEGTLLGIPPDSLALFDLVRAQLMEATLSGPEPRFDDNGSPP